MADIDIASPGADSAALTAALVALLAPDDISFTGDATGLDITLSNGRLYIGENNFAGLTATETTLNGDGLLTLSYGAVTIYTGSLQDSGAALTELDMSNVVVFNGALSGTYPSLTSLDLSSLVYLIGECHLVANSLTTLDLSGITELTASFGPSLNGLTSLDFSNLTTTANFTPSLNALTTLDLPVLVGADLGFSGNLLTTLNVPLYETDLDITAGIGFYAPLLPTISFPAIQIIGGGVALRNSIGSCVDFSFGPSLKLVANNVDLSGAAFNAASVNGILVSLAALDGTGGTTLFENQTVDLSGGTSASPSGAGLTAKATLEGRGCTVTVN